MDCIFPQDSCEVDVVEGGYGRSYCLGTIDRMIGYDLSPRMTPHVTQTSHWNSSIGSGLFGNSYMIVVE